MRLVRLGVTLTYRKVVSRSVNKWAEYSHYLTPLYVDSSAVQKEVGGRVGVGGSISSISGKQSLPWTKMKSKLKRCTYAEEWHQMLPSSD